MAGRKKKPKSKKSPKKEVPEIEKRIGHFSEEVKHLGNKIEKEFENKEEQIGGWFIENFGVIGPLVSSALGIFIFSITLYFLAFGNSFLGSIIIFRLYHFLSANIPMFFGLMLFFSYASYLSKSYPKKYALFSPISGAVGGTAFFWLLASVVQIFNLDLYMPRINEFRFYIEANLAWIFCFILLLGYLILIAKTNSGKYDVSMKEKEKNASSGRKSGKKLYRSGEEKILGGVCGGIAEYMGIDPVIVRFIWVVATLAWGSGIVLYIIMWIIMPRNPNHKWGS